MPNIKAIINEENIFKIIQETKKANRTIIEKILQKAKNKKGLSLEDTGYLLNVTDKRLLEKIFDVAGKIKKEIYGDRLVFFAPLYISSFCVNNCDYCGFHSRNKEPRKKLTLEKIEKQVKILEDMGHKRLVLEFGEDPINNPIDYVLDVIKTIYKTKSDKGEIRRVNINIAATTIQDYRKLKRVGIGTYQLFQETYHRETYQKFHRGPKANYERQLFAHDRAFEAGIDDVGLGVLFGLYDYKFEVLGLVSHAQYLDKKYGVGPHTFSVPRFQPAESVKMELPFKVSEEELLKIIAILRLAVPYTGMIISTRERPEIRAKAFKIGISQTSSASRTSPGGYGEEKDLEQFNTADHRSVDETLLSALDQNLLPSFCTACYRRERTGKKFMALAKPGEIQKLCLPNALLTFMEYLIDYASEDVKKNGLKKIEKDLEKISDQSIKKETIKKLALIKQGQRDIYF